LKGVAPVVILLRQQRIGPRPARGNELAKTESREQSIVRREAVKFLHAEIFGRYRIEHLATIPEIKRDNLLAGISQVDIDQLQSLFTSTIYPEVDQRSLRDKSFESMLRMLKAPYKLTAVIPTIPRIMIKYATLFPAALRVGLNTVMAYTLSNRLEDQMVGILMGIYEQRGQKITNTLVVTREDYLAAYVQVPYSEGRKMIGLSSVVMKAGRRRVLVQSTWDILNDVQSALITKDVHLKKSGALPQHEDDISAIEFGKFVLKKVLDTFGMFSEQVMERMIRISYITEMEYLDRMYK
jgi:hypothetical protein